MSFDWSINVGNVLTAIVLLLGLLGAHSQNIKRISEIETKVNMIFHWFQSRIINNEKGLQ